MAIFQDNLAASLAAGLFVGLVSAGPTWWGLGKAGVDPGLQRLIGGMDFAVFFVGTAYILNSGLLA